MLKNINYYNYYRTALSHSLHVSVAIIIIFLNQFKIATVEQYRYQQQPVTYISNVTEQDICDCQIVIEEILEQFN